MFPLNFLRGRRGPGRSPGAGVTPLLLLLSLLPSPPGAAAEPLSPQEAMNLAAARAPAVAAQTARVAAAAEDAVRADALPDPTLNLGLGDLVVTGPQAFEFSADPDTNRRIGLTQEWPARAKREARRAGADARRVEAEAMTTVIDLGARREGAQAWVERWAAETAVALLIELQTEGERAVDVAEAQLRGGAGAAGDALAAQAVLAELETRLVAAQARTSAARAGLARWLGADAERELAADPAFDALPIPAEALRSALERHAVLQAWQTRERVAETEVALAQAGKRPDLRFGFSYMARSGVPDWAMFEIGIDLPIFPGRRQDRDIAARHAELEATRAEREDARRSQREALERALARWQGLGEEVSRYRATLLPLARDRSAVALAAYAGGASLQPWLDARRDEIDVRLRYADTLAEFGRTWAALATLLPSDQILRETP